MVDTATSTWKEPEVRTILDWDPSSSARAVTMADTGDLSRAGDLCEQISADDRVSGVLQQRTAIQRLPLSFEGGSARAIKRLRDEGDFWRICPGAQLALLHRWYILLGAAVGRLRWVDEAGKPLIRNGLHTPAVEAWSTSRHLSKTPEEGWQAQTSTGSIESVTPGAQGWLLFAQASSRPWANAAWRSCRLWWLLKFYAIQDWSRYSERHGQGTWVVTPDEGADLSTKAQRAALAAEYKALGRSAVLVARPNWKVELIEATANNHVTFQNQVDAANSGIAISIVAQNLSSEVKGGSYAATQVHANVAGHIIASDADALSDFVHDQILVPWAVANYGSADEAPWPKWDTTPPEDVAGRMKAWVDLGTALTTFVTLKVPVDAAAACEAAGVPLRDDADLENLELEIPQPPQPPAPPGQKEEPSEEEPEPKEKAKALAVASPRAEASSSDPGDVWISKLSASLGSEMADELDGHIAELLAIVRTAETPNDYDAIRRRVVSYYRDKMDPGRVSDLTHAGLVLAQLAGRYRVRQETEEK